MTFIGNTRNNAFYCVSTASMVRSKSMNPNSQSALLNVQQNYD